MSEINFVVISGRLTADIDLRYTAASQKEVTTFTLASDIGFGDNKKNNFPDF